MCAEASTRSAKGTRKQPEKSEVVTEKVEKLNLGGGEAKLAFNTQLQQAEGGADDKFLPPIAKCRHPPPLPKAK